MRYFLLLLIVLTVSCKVSTPGRFVPDNDVTGDEIAVVNNLFVPGAEAGVFDFKTNDTAYYSSRGFTLMYLAEGAAETNNRVVMLSKLSGNTGAGFGLICGYKDDPVYGESMLVVMINAEREYLVTEITGYARTDIIAWRESLLLKGGYNQGNEVRVVCEDNGYELYINGGLETVFEDEGEPYHMSGRNGFVVVVSPLDDFPGVPVGVRFAEKRG